MTAMKTISAWDVRHELESGGHGLIVDVRTPVEFRAMHAEGAVNVPLDSLSVEQTRNPGDPLLGVWLRILSAILPSR